MITVDNAVAHFAAALGVPVAVLIPAAQIQFRWKHSGMKELLFPSAKLFIQNKPGDWLPAVEEAWNYALAIADTNSSMEALASRLLLNPQHLWEVLSVSAKFLITLKKGELGTKAH